MGFRVTVDPRIKKDYPILSKYHKYGNWKGLEVDIEIYPVGMRFEFYQNFNTGDRAKGQGKYAFRKYKLMPYLIKKRLEYTFNQLTELLQSKMECNVVDTDNPKEAEKSIIGNKQSSCHNKTPVNSLEDFQYQLSQYDVNHNSWDCNKKKIECGQIKYFRDYRTGRLFRGRVYHNLNNMWWVLINKYSYTNMASWELFDPTPEDFMKKRVKKGHMPEEKKKEIELLNSLSTGKLKLLLNKKLKQAI
jgi:hypothetical protein